MYFTFGRWSNVFGNTFLLQLMFVQWAIRVQSLYSLGVCYWESTEIWVECFATHILRVPVFGETRYSHQGERVPVRTIWFCKKRTRLSQRGSCNSIHVQMLWDHTWTHRIRVQSCTRPGQCSTRNRTRMTTCPHRGTQTANQSAHSYTVPLQREIDL